MLTLVRREVSAVVTLAVLPLLASAQTTDPGKPARSGPVKLTPNNTLTYDHVALTGKGAAPYVLAVGHGEYFQVVFEHTDPRFFNYSISAVSDESPKTAGQAGANQTVAAEATHTTAVTMRHDRHIQKYTVSIAAKTAEEVRTKKGASESDLREAANRGETLPDILYPISFDLWVRTSEWAVGFNGGFAFSNVTSEKFYIQTDTKGTPATDDDVKTVKKDIAARDSFRPDIIALANLSHTDRFYGLGMAFGVGIGDNSDPRYFVGPSWVFGKNFILTGGWTGGKVNTLPLGQAEDTPPIAGDNTLNTPGSRFRHGFYFGVGFTVADKKDAFLGALTATTKSTKPAAAAPAGEVEQPTEAEEKTDQRKLVGTYETADGKQRFVVALKDPAKADLTIAIDGKPAIDLKWQKDQGTRFDAAGAKVHFIVPETDKPTGMTYQAAGAVEVEAKKTK